MKIGRLILTPKFEGFEALVAYYQPKSDYLVIAYNQDNFKPPPTINVHLVPYSGVGKEVVIKHNLNASLASHPLGTNWRAWVRAAIEFPDVDFWIIHDYDVICKPHDREIEKVIPERSYGMIGHPLPRFKPGINIEQYKRNVYPFTHSKYEFLWHARDVQTQRTDLNFLGVMESEFPFVAGGVRTILCGYGDIIAAPADLLLKLNDVRLKAIELGGIEQVIHCLAHQEGYHAVNLAQYFKVRIKFSPLIWFYSKDKIIHPVKDMNAMVSLKAKLVMCGKNLISAIFKKIFGHEGIGKVKRHFPLFLRKI